MSAGSTFGNYFRITTWGESHGEALGVVVDGCPAGLTLDASDIQAYLDRRKPGQSRYTTPRKEADEVRILSGVFDGKTTGTPISLLVPNTSQRSADYEEIASYYRPGMPIIHLIKNTVFAIIVAAGVPQDVKRSAESPQEPLP